MFGKSYKFNDPEFIFFKNGFEYHRLNLDSLSIVDQWPILKAFYHKTFNNIIKNNNSISTKIIAKYADHLKDRKHGIIRDVCDGLIEAKQEAITEEKESAKHLNDNNLAVVIKDLFRRMIGDRMATQNDKNKCVYVMAFIMECLRYRPPAPFGLIHRAMCDAILEIIVSYATHFCRYLFGVYIHHSPQHWTNPHIFDPNRFISSDGKQINSKHAAFMPFGIGRRVCLGRKLALETLFLITVRLLQSTNGYSIVLPNGNQTANLEPDPNAFMFNAAQTHQIMLKPNI